jgi:hypothetical protein
MLTDKQIRANQYAISFTLQLESFVKANIYPDFTCSLKLDWSAKRTSSRGGIYKTGPGINIAMNSAALLQLPEHNIYRFYEYPAYDSDATIGGFYSTQYEHKLKAIIAHEVAHAVQFLEYKKTNTRCKPHGTIFKKYYKLFRTTFVNSALPNQAMLQKKYQDSIAKLSVTSYGLA